MRGRYTYVFQKLRFSTNNWAPYGTLPLAKGGLDYARQYDYAENPSNSSLNQPWNGFLSLRKTAARVLACNQEGNAKDQVPLRSTRRSNGKYQ